MNDLPKIVMGIGVLILIIGFIMHFIPIGRLPGDIIIKKENSTFYFPITTCILLSVGISLLFYVIGKFR